MITMAAITANVGLDLGIPDAVRREALAYLVIVLESTHEDRLDDDVSALGELLVELGAMEVYVLPAQAATQLISAREKAFFVAKAAGADDIVDVVVPRAAIPAYMAAVAAVAGRARRPHHRVRARGRRQRPPVGLPARPRAPPPGPAGRCSGPASTSAGPSPASTASARRRSAYFHELEDPVKLDLMRAIKRAFDPHGILGPGQPPRLRHGPWAGPERDMNGAQSLIRTLVGCGVDTCFIQPRHLRDALRGGARRRARDAGRAGPVRGGGDRRRRRLRPHGRTARRHPAAPRSRASATASPTCTTPAAPRTPGGQRRRRPRHHPPAPTTRRSPSDIESLARPVSRWFRSSSSPGGAARRHRRRRGRRPSARPAAWPRWWCRPTCRGRRRATRCRAARHPVSRAVPDDAVDAAAKALRVGRAGRRAGRRGGAAAPGPHRRQPGGRRHRGQAPVRDLPRPARARRGPAGRGAPRLPGRVHAGAARGGRATWCWRGPRRRCRSSPTRASPAYLVPPGARCTPSPTPATTCRGPRRLADALGRAGGRAPGPAGAATRPAHGRPRRARPWRPPSARCSPRTPS